MNASTKIRISKKSMGELPPAVAEQITALRSRFSFHSFTLVKKPEGFSYIVGEGEHVTAVMDGKVVSAETASMNNLDGVGVKIGGIGSRITPPAGAWLIVISYYTRYFCTVYSFGPKPTSWPGTARPEIDRALCAPMNNESVKIAGAGLDRGGADRALMVARDLLNRGAWDGKEIVVVNDPYLTYAALERGGQVAVVREVSGYLNTRIENPPAVKPVVLAVESAFSPTLAEYNSALEFSAEWDAALELLEVSNAGGS